MLPIAPTATATSSITSTIKQLEAAYGPSVQTAGHRAAAAYFANFTLIEVASILITAAFTVGIAIIIMKTGWLRVRLERIDDVLLKSNRAKKHIKKSWSEVERHFFSGDDNDLKIAIIKADTLLDEALSESGIHGGDLGERLQKLGPEKLPNIEHLWEAHKLRNRIAHDADFVLKRDLAERALTVYEQALEHFGILPKLPVIDSEPDSEPENRSPQSP